MSYDKIKIINSQDNVISGKNVMELQYTIGTPSISNIKHHAPSTFEIRRLPCSKGILLWHYIRLALLIMENRNVYTLDPLTNLFSYIR